MFKDFDWVIVIAVIILGGFSLAIIQSVMPQLFNSQLIFYLAGLVIFYLFSKTDFQIFRPFWFPIYIVSCLLLLVVLVLGFESRGAVRWIEIAGFRLQLSEILKPFFLISFASFLSNRPPRKLKDLVVSGIFCIVPFFLVLRQPDLGSALIYAFAFFGMIFISGIPLRYLLSSFLSFFITLPVVWHFLHDYQKRRILSFLNPENDPQGSSYNAIQATIAVGSGMIFGKGLGHGTQSQLLFLPEKHTDFIFASLVEELGLFGAVVLLSAYLLIFYRIFKILSWDDDAFGNIFLIGVLFMFLGQVFINVGMNIGILPVTGITLPFVSYGGSSIIALMITLGIVENIAKDRQFGVKSHKYL